MLPSDPQAPSLSDEEQAILEATRRVAPAHGIESRRAQAYAIWTICFRRYCRERGRPWLWMTSVSDFMDYLDGRADVSADERDRALDGIMFYLTDVHDTRQEDEPAEAASDVPDSTQRLFAQMLLRCDVGLTEALQLRASDIDPVQGRLSIPADETMGTGRTLSLPDTLVEGFRRHLGRLGDQATTDDPLLFADTDGGAPRPAEHADTAEEENARRSTELATRVMRTFDQDELHG